MNYAYGSLQNLLAQKKTEEAIRLSAERLETLHRHAIDLDQAETVEDIAKSTFDAIEKSLGFHLGGSGIVKDGLLRFIHLRGARAQEILEMPPDGLGVTVRTVPTGKTQLATNTRKDKDFTWPFMGMPMPLSELAVPVRIDEEVVARAYTDHDVFHWKRIFGILQE